MEKVDSFIRDLKEGRKLESDKYKKAEMERHAEEAEMVNDLVEATGNSQICTYCSILLSTHCLYYKINYLRNCFNNLPIWYLI